MGEPNLDDIIDPTDSAPRDPTGHAKQAARPNDEELQRRTAHERVQAGVEDYSPDDVPSATE